MSLEVKVPAVGESVKEAIIHKWHKSSGEFVNIDDVLLELETDKATMEIVAEAAGVLAIVKQKGDLVKIGEVIARIDTAAKGQSKSEVKSAEPPAARPVASPGEISRPAASGDISRPLSPAVRKIVAENNLQPEMIAASGPGGRLLKSDALGAVETSLKAVASGAQNSPLKIAVSPAMTHSAAPVTSSARSERREPMSMLRRRIAERLLMAKNTTAMLTTFNEIDMTAVLKLRAQYKEAFEKKHGTPLGFMGFFVKASIEGLKAFPRINGWIDGNDIVYHDYYDMGVAVSTERGLVVPVVRNADRLSMAELEHAVAGFAKKAREGKISVDDMSGGTFTVSNGGVFGSLMSTPILNPPQSAILGMHKTQERPVVIGGQIVARPMMYVAVSYDHRIVDGKEAVQFLVKIKEAIEDPARLLLGV